MIPRVLLASAALFVASSAITAAHAGCKVEVVTDDFSGESKSVATGKFYDTLGKLEITKVGDQTTLTYPLFVYAGVDLPLPAENKVQFKLEDGKLLELSPTQLVAPEVVAWGATITTKWNATFPVTDADVDALAGSKVKAVNVPLVAEQSKVIDHAKGMHKLLAKSTQSMAECVVKKR